MPLTIYMDMLLFGEVGIMHKLHQLFLDIHGFPFVHNDICKLLSGGRKIIQSDFGKSTITELSSLI